MDNVTKSSGRYEHCCLHMVIVQSRPQRVALAELWNNGLEIP